MKPVTFEDDKYSDTRFRLLGWCASEEAVIFSIDLTSSSPGEARQTFSWLAVTSPDHGLALTVHKDLFVVSVISIGGIHCGKVVPILPDWGYEEEAVAMVEQVEVHGLTAIIKVVVVVELLFDQTFIKSRWWPACQSTRSPPA